MTVFAPEAVGVVKSALEDGSVLGACDCGECAESLVYESGWALVRQESTFVFASAVDTDDDYDDPDD